MIGSCICKYSDFEAPWYRAAERVLRIRELYRGHSSQRHDFANRKFWEWCAIATALQERWITRPKALGIGFAVGTEPLASHFAACGCDVLGTDLDAAAADPAWVNTAQHARSLEQMHKPQLVSADEFARHVSFAPMDMRAIRGAEQSRDFVWSSCALEHLGSLEAGIEFLLKSSQLLRAGGVAAHTTEINLSSNDETLTAGPDVIYRRRDIEELAGRLSEAGFELAAVDWDSGTHPVDLDPDKPPYFEGPHPHVKLELGGFVTTSMLLVITRPS